MAQAVIMNLAETELKIGNTSFKGVYIAILLSLATSLGGMVWGASALYARLETLEAVNIPNIKPITERVTLIEQRLEDNDVGQLKGNLATLGTNLETILDQQEKLLELKSDVSRLEKDIEAMRSTVKQAEIVSNSLTDVADKMKKLDVEINNLWDGLDYVTSNPLR
jgi:peptidoglycan hydrolase CwlO-like protein